MFLENGKSLQENKSKGHCLFFMYEPEVKNEKLREKIINMNNTHFVNTNFHFYKLCFSLGLNLGG